MAAEPPPEKTPETKEYVTGLKLVAIMTSISLAAFLLLLDISIISTVRGWSTRPLLCVVTYTVDKAIPRITEDFNSLEDVGWYAGAYQLAKYDGSLVPGSL